MLVFVLYVTAAAAERHAPDNVNSKPQQPKQQPQPHDEPKHARSGGVAVDDQLAAARALVFRFVPPKLHGNFTFTTADADADADAMGDSYHFSAKDGQVTIAATNGVAAASAFYGYLAHFCGGSVTWGTGANGTNTTWGVDHIHFPTPLPDTPAGGVKRTATVPWRYALNVVTYGYTLASQHTHYGHKLKVVSQPKHVSDPVLNFVNPIFFMIDSSQAWWDEARWFREIDFMALHGINLPLASMGQEYVWQQVYRLLGVADMDIIASFSGSVLPVANAFVTIHNMWGMFKSGFRPLSDCSLLAVPMSSRACIRGKGDWVNAI